MSSRLSVVLQSYISMRSTTPQLPLRDFAQGRGLFRSNSGRALRGSRVGAVCHTGATKQRTAAKAKSPESRRAMAPMGTELGTRHGLRPRGRRGVDVWGQNCGATPAWNVFILYVRRFDLEALSGTCRRPFILNVGDSMNTLIVVHLLSTDRTVREALIWR